ncbi:hypothetical protein [Streptacidiphilus rugosus]|uniref:hypothetical protein n=1 Tax=Streptacidiphilus rugosus TaxID=405783 RepID=UPI0012FC2A51|nr:hypothetical protein [Streptacidiphilus rugosus]
MLFKSPFARFYDHLVSSVEELKAAVREADQRMVAYAASMSERSATQWTLEERARLHQLSEAARQARLALLRAIDPTVRPED